jgi:hypothetical protein
MATSAAGGVRVELQDAEGDQITGFTLQDCQPLFGNHVEKEVKWVAGRDLAELAGESLRIRFTLKDADIFAFQFK